LTEERARGLYSFNGRDLSVELEELHQHVVGVENKRAAEAVQLLWLVMENLHCPGRPGHVPIRDILAQLRSAQVVLMAASLVLEHLWEEHASGIGPWV
jgi:hypothetical protein